MILGGTMQRNFLVLTLMALAFAAAASADTFSYYISIDTSRVSGTEGGIYLDFSPGSDVTEIDISAWRSPERRVVPGC